MEAKTFFVAEVIFAVVALFHLVRIVMDWSVIIGEWSITALARKIALSNALSARLDPTSDDSVRPCESGDAAYQ